ncbi:MAG: hypothetical protein KA436_04940 [Oligoflexales bacterium]|nr:hypothetical protein [Oligoflexales bacterium]
MRFSTGSQPFYRALPLSFLLSSLLVMGSISLLGIPQTGLATQIQISTEKKFQDVFITAGYSTALGAALGAATVGLSSNPNGKLRYIAVGASIGFISGSFLGSYVVLSPIFSGEMQTYEPQAYQGESSQPFFKAPQDADIVVSPILSSSDSLSGMSVSWLIRKF